MVDKYVPSRKTNLSRSGRTARRTYLSRLYADDVDMSVPVARHKASKALQVLAKNLATLMDDPDSKFRTPQAVAAKAKTLNRKLSYKTVARTRSMDNEPGLDSVEAMAKVFGLEAWQLLIPDLRVGEHLEIRRESAVEVV